MPSKKIKTSIVGGSGYAGGEILRILLCHPKVQIGQVTSRKFAEEPVTLVHPNLRGLTDLNFIDPKELIKCDLLFVCLPNGQSLKQMAAFKKLAPKIIDLGSDFRLNKDFVYGLAEINRSKIKKARYVACGGCEATAIILALNPLVKQGLIKKESIIADVKVGSSAAGSGSFASTHHPERHGVLRSYKPTNHRHQKEIRQELKLNVAMSATAVNVVRGILVTIHTNLKKGFGEKDVWKAYRKIYGKELFIRIVKSKRGLYRYPEPKILWGTNYCDIGFEKDEKSNRLVIISAIDNLVKGTGGQAIQAMNIMYGFDEALGLNFSGLHPV